MLLYQILAPTIDAKILKSHPKTINLKYQIQHRMINLNYLMDHLLYQVFKIILSMSSKTMKQVSDNPPIRICVNKIELN